MFYFIRSMFLNIKNYLVWIYLSVFILILNISVSINTPTPYIYLSLFIGLILGLLFSISLQKEDIKTILIRVMKMFIVVTSYVLICLYLNDYLELIIVVTTFAIIYIFLLKTENSYVVFDRMVAVILISLFFVSLQAYSPFYDYTVIEKDKETIILKPGERTSNYLLEPIIRYREVKGFTNIFVKTNSRIFATFELKNISLDSLNEMKSIELEIWKTDFSNKIENLLKDSSIDTRIQIEKVLNDKFKNLDIKVNEIIYYVSPIVYKN